MSRSDPVLARLSELPCIEPTASLSAKIRAAALPKLEPRKINPAWSLAVAVSVLGYLVWAIHFVAVISQGVSG